MRLTCRWTVHGNRCKIELETKTRVYEYRLDAHFSCC